MWRLGWKTCLTFLFASISIKQNTLTVITALCSACYLKVESCASHRQNIDINISVFSVCTLYSSTTTRLLWCPLQEFLFRIILFTAALPKQCSEKSALAYICIFIENENHIIYIYIMWIVLIYSVHMALLSIVCLSLWPLLCNSSWGFLLCMHAAQITKPPVTNCDLWFWTICIKLLKYSWQYTQVLRWEVRLICLRK